MLQFSKTSSVNENKLHGASATKILRWIGALSAQAGPVWGLSVAQEYFSEGDPILSAFKARAALAHHHKRPTSSIPARKPSICVLRQSYRQRTAALNKLMNNPNKKIYSPPLTTEKRFQICE